MRPWRRKRSLLGGGVEYVTTFEGTERDLLLNLAAIVADSLMERARPTPKNELAEITGMPIGCSEAPSGPKLVRLLPDFTKPSKESAERENAFIHQLYESETIESKPHSLCATIGALKPAESGQVSILESDAHAWVTGINGLRIYLHVSTKNLSGSIGQTE